MRFFTRDNKTELPTGHDNPESEYFVPEPLRDDYTRTTAVPDNKAFLNTWLPAAIKDRAERHIHQRDQEHARTHGGRLPARMPGDNPIAAIIEAGYVDGDTDRALHMFRLTTAQNAVAGRQRAAEEDRKREAAKCQACGAYDTGTAPAVIPAPFGTTPKDPAGFPTPGITKVTAGRVCRPCALEAVAQHLAEVAEDVLADGRRRADAVAALLDREGKTQR